MARKKPQGNTKPVANKPNQKRMSNAERSAYFARREAAKVLRTILQGDSRRRAVGSIKSLVYSPSVRNKKATYALVCQTLKCKFTFPKYLLECMLRELKEEC